MTRVDFYTGSDDKLRTACQISQKALHNNVRVLLHVPDEDTAHTLDQLLWHFPQTAFLPHGRNHHPDAATFPILIACDEHFPHTELLISLHNVCLPFYTQFERVIEIVSAEENDARQGRERFKWYREQGCQVNHIPLTPSP